MKIVWSKCGMLTTQPSQFYMIINFRVFFCVLVGKINMKSCHMHGKMYIYAVLKISHKLRFTHSMLFYPPNICKCFVLFGYRGLITFLTSYYVSIVFQHRSIHC